MKNKLASLSLSLLLALIAFGALFLFVNAFGLASGAHASLLGGGARTSNGGSTSLPVSTQNNSTSAALTQNANGTSSGLSQTPFGGTQSTDHHHHDDDGGSYG